MSKDIPSEIISAINIKLGKVKWSYLTRGSFGRIYKIKSADGTSVIKKIKKRKKKKSKEFEILKGLDDPHVIKLYFEMSDAHYFYGCMELCERGCLFTYLRKKNFTVRKSKPVIRCIVDGLDYIHDKCIIHGDIKIENIFLTSDMTAKIGDFGHAVVTSQPREEVADTMKTSTLCCMAPERETFQNISYKLDIWGLGVVIYEMLVNESLLSDGDDEDDPGTRDEDMNAIMEDRFEEYIEFRVKDTNMRKLICHTLKYNARERPDEQEIKKYLI